MAIALLGLIGALAPLSSSVAGPAEESPGRVFRTNLSDDLQTTDPFSFYGLAAYGVLSQIYEGFVALGADGQIIPALATSWQSQDGGLTWHITLRSGVRFSSGRLFSADDVRWSFTQMLKPRPQTSLGTFALRRVVGARDVQEGRNSLLAGVEIIDRYTVDIHLTEPDAVFPLTPFLLVDSGIEADQGPDWAKHGSAGTGPFRLVAWHRSQDIVLEANSGYWNGPPTVKTVRLSVIAHAETVLALADAGALDFAVIPDSEARAVLGDAHYADRRLTFPRTQMRYLGLNQGLYPPFGDHRVREAVGLALNRDVVITGLYHGAAVGLNGPIPPGLGGYQSGNIAPIPYDPARARQLLAEAGYNPEHPLPPLDLIGTDSVRDDVNVYAQQLSEALGIPVGIRILEHGAAITAGNEGKLAFFLSGWTAIFPDAMSILQPVWYASSPFNRSRWGNPAFDHLMDEAQATPDDTQRHALCQEAERILMADHAMIPVPVPMLVALARKGVTGVRVLPTGIVDFRNAVVP